MPSETQSMSHDELDAVVHRLQEREEARILQERRDARNELQHQRNMLGRRVEQLTRSIEVIKWSILSIAAVMALGLAVIIGVVVKVGNEAERIKSEVEVIQEEAEKIADKIRHPIETLGGALGRRIDNDLGELIGPSE